MLQSIMEANNRQSEKMDTMQKEISLLKARSAAILDPSLMDQDEQEKPEPAGPTPVAATTSHNSTLPLHAVTEANKRHFAGKKFDQKTEEALEWADYFRGYLSTHTWDLAPDLQEAVAMRMLGEALAGSIEQFWFAEIRKSKKTCKEILEELEDSFTPDHLRQQAGSIDGLKECKQKEGENTKVYLLRFERALARHRRAMLKKRLSIDEVLIRQVLYAGVKSDRIAKTIKKAPNLLRALADAKTVAEEESQWSYLRSGTPEKSITASTEPEDTSTSEKPTAAEEASTPARASAPPPTKPVVADSTDVTMAALVKGMNDLKIMLGKKQGLSSNPRVPSAPRTRARMDKSDIVCFNCDQKGHYSNECVIAIETRQGTREGRCDNRDKTREQEKAGVITETRLGNKRVTKEEARTSEVYCTEVERYLYLYYRG